MSRPILIEPEVLVTAPIAALIVAAPAPFRSPFASHGTLECWLAAAGLVCPLLVVAIAIARGARRGVRAVAPGAAMSFVVGASLWAIVALPSTIALGAFLKVNTHHRALGGATFAVFALALLLGAALVAWRATALVLARVPSASIHRAFAVLFGAAALVLVGATVAAAALAQDAPEAAGATVDASAWLVDGALAFATTALAAFFDLPRQRWSDATWMGSGVLVFLMAIGVGLMYRSPLLARAVAEAAPLAGAVAEPLGLAGR
jgi:hypothetical protein